MECRRVNEVSVNNVDLKSAILVGNDASIASNGDVYDYVSTPYIKGHNVIVDENGFYIVDENNNYIND